MSKQFLQVLALSAMIVAMEGSGSKVFAYLQCHLIQTNEDCREKEKTGDCVLVNNMCTYNCTAVTKEVEKEFKSKKNVGDSLNFFSKYCYILSANSCKIKSKKEITCIANYTIPQINGKEKKPKDCTEVTKEVNQALELEKVAKTQVLFQVKCKALSEGACKGALLTKENNFVCIHELTIPTLATTSKNCTEVTKKVKEDIQGFNPSKLTPAFLRGQCDFLSGGACKGVSILGQNNFNCTETKTFEGDCESIQDTKICEKNAKCKVVTLKTTGKQACFTECSQFTKSAYRNKKVTVHLPPKVLPQYIN